MEQETGHVSVLLQEAIDGLHLSPNDVVVDATLGGAGHFAKILSILNAEGMLVGIDADGDAIERAQAVLDSVPSDDRASVRLVNDNFRNIEAILEREGIEAPTKFLFDLGWSGFHLTSGRGFSFRVEEPLLMTYGNPEESQTAADLVNSLPESELAELIFTFGEERFSRGIARSIIRARSQERILTTTQLVNAILAGTPSWYHHRRLHPATKTFQALRIAVNEELDALREGLEAAITHTAVGGRIAVITFHSIEDRIVKNMFRDAAQAGKGTLITRKPEVPSAAESSENPRARSAKLRVFEAGCRESSSFTTHKSLSLYA